MTESKKPIAKKVAPAPRATVIQNETPKVQPVEETKEDTQVSKSFPANLETKAPSTDPAGVIVEYGNAPVFKETKLSNGNYKVPTIYLKTFSYNSSRPTFRKIHSGNVPVNKAQLDALKKKIGQ